MVPLCWLIPDQVPGSVLSTLAKTTSQSDNLGSAGLPPGSHSVLWINDYCWVDSYGADRPRLQLYHGSVSSKENETIPPATNQRKKTENKTISTNQTKKKTVFSGTESKSEPSPSDLPTTPCRTLPMQPSIHLIAIRDPPVYQLIQTLSISPPVISIPVTTAATTPAYIFCELNV